VCLQPVILAIGESEPVRVKVLVRNEY
jgi:hypothetical protein